MRHLARWFAALRRALPVGRGLSDEVWERRHRGVLWLVLAHVPILVIFGEVTGHSLGFSFAAVSPVVLLGAVAWFVARSRFLRSAAATTALVSCSALLVHLSHGTTEMHFHFFVVIGVITLYQDWAPFGLAILFVVLHHGVLGVLDAKDVYSNPAASQHPWLWAGVHGGFVLAASAVHVLAWRLNEDQALRDPLTKLPNRVLFSDRLGMAVAKRNRRDGVIAVMFIDLDGFKGINDTLGHQAGDRLLVEMSRRLQDTLRDGDTAARFGGDEFAILLEDVADCAPTVVAERVLDALRQPVRLDGRDHHVGASIGVVTVDRDLTTDEILRNADLAMYMAKASGRGRVELFDDSMFDDVVGHADLEADLRVALARGELNVHYQPSVDLDSGAIVGMEALARWRHAERGPVPPSVFIPIAEAANLIRELFQSVLIQACHDAVGWQRRHPSITVAVNVSAHQLLDDAVTTDVLAALTASGLPPESLVLEITESALIKDVDRVAETLTGLKALGLRIAIDDFGTGYSSLSYLRRFPVDILKIDKSFVDQLPGDGAALARSIVRLGEALQLEVIGEGVEADSQRGELKRLGCHQGQGYLFTAPQSATDVNLLLDKAVDSSTWWDAAPVTFPELSAWAGGSNLADEATVAEDTAWVGGAT